jgi:hypothetical protein
MSRLLLDEMLAPAIAIGLRDLGHDVIAVVEDPTLRGLADADVLELATGQDRVVVTLNIGDFAALDRSWRSNQRTHGGIMMVSTTSFPQGRGFIGRVIAATHARCDADTLPAAGGIDFL